MYSALYRTFCLPALVLAASLLWSASLFAQVNLLSRSSFLNTSDFTFDGNDQLVTTEFSEFGLFDESSVVGNIQAAQLSSFMDNVFEVQTNVVGGNSSSAAGLTEAITIFNATFEVTSVSQLSLRGMLVEDFLGEVEGGSSLTIVGPDTEISFSTNPSFTTVPLLLDQIINPGVYDFEVNSSSLGGTSDSPPAGSASADVQLFVVSASVPEPSSLLLLFGLAMPSLLRRRTSL